MPGTDAGQKRRPAERPDGTREEGQNDRWVGPIARKGGWWRAWVAQGFLAGRSGWLLARLKLSTLKV